MSVAGIAIILFPFCGGWLLGDAVYAGTSCAALGKYGGGSESGFSAGALLLHAARSAPELDDSGPGSSRFSNGLDDFSDFSAMTG